MSKTIKLIMEGEHFVVVYLTATGYKTLPGRVVLCDWEITNKGEHFCKIKLWVAKFGTSDSYQPGDLLLKSKSLAGIKLKIRRHVAKYFDHIIV